MRISNAYVPRVVARALSDVSIASALLRTMHFLSPPSSLFAPAMLAKVLLPRGRASNSSGRARSPEAAPHIDTQSIKRGSA